MTTDKLTITSVNVDENIRALRDFRNMLKTTMGPEGCAKFLVTGGDIFQLTATSTSLISRLDLEHPICRYIGQMAQSFPDLGLYFGVMVSYLVEQAWVDTTFSKLKLSSSVQTLLKSVQRILNSDIISRKVDFSSINSFLPLVRTIISSKCPTLIFNIDINSFCIEIVKAFLNCVDDRNNSVGRVIIKVEIGPNSVSSHNGLLYLITEDAHIKIIKELIDEVKVLVFTIKLDDSDNMNLVDHIMPIIKQAVESNVRLIACQKTVAAEIKLYLMRKNVILMDRMGTDLTDNLIQISQAFPISQICFGRIPDINNLTGTLTSVQHIQFNESNYILLKNTDNSVSTLLIQSYCIAGTDHLEVLTRQAINSLRYLALHPTLTFGGGCLEIWLIAQIHLLKETQNDKEFLKLSNWFQKSLLTACGTTPPNSLDSVYHHGWTDKALACKCGLLTSEDVSKAGGLLFSLEEFVNNCSVVSVKLDSPKHSTKSISCDVLVDSYQQKLNVIVSVIETFANITDIGFIVYKD